MATEKRDLHAVIVDRNRLFREGLIRALSGSGIRQVTEYSTIEDLPLDRVIEPKPDLLLVDLASPASQHFRSALLAHRDRYGCLIVAFYDEAAIPPAEVDETREIVDAILPKNRIGSERLGEAIDLLLAGLRIFPTRPAAPAAGEAAMPPSATTHPSIHGLTPREKLVLLHLMQGASNKWIARHLGIAESTVKIHLRNLMAKLGARNRTQAAAWGLSLHDRGPELKR